MEVQVTAHARKRMKSRLGLPKSAIQRLADTAFESGHQHKDARGKAKRYLDRLFLLQKSATNLRVYGDFVYVFCDQTLVTVFQLPHNCRGGIK